jgi:hypothetical protein
MLAPEALEQQLEQLEQQQHPEVQSPRPQAWEQRGGRC